MRTRLGWHTDCSLVRPWAKNPSYTIPDPQEWWGNKCVLFGAADSWWFVIHKQKMNCFKTFYYGEFPGGPVVWTLSFHCRRQGFDPWLGNPDPTSCKVWPFFFNYGKVQTYTERVNCLVYPYLVSAVINTWPILFLSVLLLIEKSKC